MAHTAHPHCHTLSSSPIAPMLWKQAGKTRCASFRPQFLAKAAHSALPCPGGPLWSPALLLCPSSNSGHPSHPP